MSSDTVQDLGVSLTALQQQKNGEQPIKTLNTIPLAPPAPILPKNPKKLKLLDIDPVELARQLTLMEAALYKKIRPMECLQRSREYKPGRSSDNITSMIQLANRVGAPCCIHD